MSQVNLKEMEASDMLDVLHFLFEEDFTATSEDHARSRSGLRDEMYRSMYGVKYPYKMKPPRTNGSGVTNADIPSGFADDLSDVAPFNPRTEKDAIPGPSKAKYVPASSVPTGEQNLQGLTILN